MYLLIQMYLGMAYYALVTSTERWKFQEKVMVDYLFCQPPTPCIQICAIIRSKIKSLVWRDSSLLPSGLNVVATIIKWDKFPLDYLDLSIEENGIDSHDGEPLPSIDLDEQDDIIW